MTTKFLCFIYKKGKGWILLDFFVCHHIEIENSLSFECIVKMIFNYIFKALQNYFHTIKYYESVHF